MKLSELVNFKNRLNNSLKVAGIQTHIDGLCNTILSIRDVNVTGEHNEYLQKTIDNLKAVIDELTRIEQTLADRNNKIDEDIGHLSRKFYAQNYDLELAYDTAQSIREVRQLYVPKEAFQPFLSRIGRYVDWRYPVLEFGCRDGEMTKYLVAGDPLYITDNYQEFIDNTMNQFDDQYRNRIRSYLIHDFAVNSTDTVQIDFSMLPQEQFGFVFSFNYFNYRSIQGFKDYLSEIFKLLRPGGVMMFTYNNADLGPAASYAENYFMSYMPKSLLIPLATSLGFDIVADFDYNTLSWLEIKKPGELKTIKAHQALAEIKTIKSSPKSLTA